MEREHPHVVRAEWVDDGVVVSFEDGEDVFYPGELLYRLKGEARVLRESGEDGVGG
jgi:hypothetical protein